MKLEQTIQTAIDLIKKHKASDFEISLLESSGFSTDVRLGKTQTLEYHLNKSLSINVYFGKNKGNVSSVDLSIEGLKKAINSACLIAKYTEEDLFNGLAPKEKMAWKLPELNLYHPWNITSTKSIEIAKECEAVALDYDEISNSDGAQLSSLDNTLLYANSNGLIAKSRNSMHSLYCSLIAKRKTEMQTAYEYSVALDAKDLISAKKIGIQAAKLTQQKLGSQKLKSQKCPVIFNANQARSLFASLLNALSGSRQYKKSSFLQDSINKQVLPKNIDIMENPLEVKTIGSKAFDADGMAKQKQFFVKKGIVMNYIMGQYSANQMGLKSTANAGGVNNCYINSTIDGSLEDLIKEMHTGLLVTDLMGQGINDTTGDYSRGAQGFWVENAAIQYPVSAITIAGNLKDMFLNISAIANDVDKRGNIKVGSTLINEITIAGGN